MAIRLRGGYERDGFWHAVRDIGNDKLDKLGLSDWTVTVRPATASDAERAEQGDETAFCTWDSERRELDVAFAEDGAAMGTARQVAEIQIVDLVEQIAYPDPDDDDDDRRPRLRIVRGDE